MSRDDFRFPWRGRHVIRPAQPPDYGEVVGMLQALSADVGNPRKPLASVDSLLTCGPSGRKQFEMLVAEPPAEAALDGLCLYSWVFSGWRGATGLFIADLYVAPPARGIGLGRGLLAAAVSRESTNGARFLKLDVDHQNLGAIAFYEKLGFHPHHGERMMVLEEEFLAEL